MSPCISLQQRIDDYLAERRRLGFELRSRDTLLATFARYVAGRHHRGPLTADLMVDWARQDKWHRDTQATWAARLARVRHFARYLKQFEPDTEVPEELVFGPEPGRVAPHIFHENEIVELLAASGQLGPRGSIRPATYETLFGLMASTGVRVSEAIHLRDADVDLKHGMLTIRQTKFAKSRQLPMHPSTVAALARYRRQRARHIPARADMAFLDHLERQRHNSVRSRNARLAALRSFLKFAAHRDVASLQVIERALGVPVKRFERPMFGYLSRDEILAVIGTPDGSWLSQRDHVMFLLMYNTGARVSEIVGIEVGEVILDDGAACVHLHGKGRKQRSVPLWRSTVKVVRAWLRANPQFVATSPLLPNRNGSAMTRSNVTKRLMLAVQAAAAQYPRLTQQRVSPHTIRHTTAMHLLQAGVDISVIALWLGHESPVTTHHYVEADLTMKERALAKLHEPDAKIQRYRAPDSLLDFLKTL